MSFDLHLINKINQDTHAFSTILGTVLTACLDDADADPSLKYLEELSEFF